MNGRTTFQPNIDTNELAEFGIPSAKAPGVSLHIKSYGKNLTTIQLIVQIKLLLRFNGNIRQMLQLGKTDIFESLNQLKIQQIRGNVQTLTNYLQIAEKVIKRYYHYLNTIIKVKHSVTKQSKNYLYQDTILNKQMQ